jgi:hypothetical protein
VVIAINHRDMRLVLCTGSSEAEHAALTRSVEISKFSRYSNLLVGRITVLHPAVNRSDVGSIPTLSANKERQIMARPRKAPVPQIVESTETVVDTRSDLIKRLSTLFKEEIICGYSDELLSTLARDHLGD